MHDVDRARRDASRSTRSHVALGIALASCSLAGCADLLGLPSDPYLAEEPGVMSAQGGPTLDARTGDAREPGGEPLRRKESEGDGGSAAGSASTPVPSTSPPATSPAMAGAVPTNDVQPDEPASSRRAADAGAGAVDERADPDEGADPDADGAAPDDGVIPDDVVGEVCGSGETVGPSGLCYIALSTPAPWDEARQSCMARGPGWDLASIRDEANDRFIGTLVADEAWIGGSDAEDEGEWLWVDDGTPFWSGTGTDGAAVGGAYENWNADEPNGRGNSDCARLVRPASAGGLPIWADRECFELLGAICQGPPL